jgi:hypothetical protein
LSPDNAALLSFAESLKNKTAILSVTAYRSIDPVDLFITIGYQYSITCTINNQAVNPNNLWFINPIIGFVANSEIILTGGFTLNFRQLDTVNSMASGNRTTQT